MKRDRILELMMAYLDALKNIDFIENAGKVININIEISGNSLMIVVEHILNDIHKDLTQALLTFNEDGICELNGIEFTSLMGLLNYLCPDEA